MHKESTDNKSEQPIYFVLLRNVYAISQENADEVLKTQANDYIQGKERKKKKGQYGQKIITTPILTIVQSVWIQRKFCDTQYRTLKECVVLQ